MIMVFGVGDQFRQMSVYDKTIRKEGKNQWKRKTLIGVIWDLAMCRQTKDTCPSIRMAHGMKENSPRIPILY